MNTYMSELKTDFSSEEAMRTKLKALYIVFKNKTNFLPYHVKCLNEVQSIFDRLL